MKIIGEYGEVESISLNAKKLLKFINQYTRSYYKTSLSEKQTVLKQQTVFW